MVPNVSYGFEYIPANSVIEIVFYALIVFYVIFTAILYYHWTTYAANKIVSSVTLLAFLVSTVPLLLIMGSMLLLI